jgi:aspartyl-tRNA(Asn)/glutamyl-tRNA(Gln) amidotransferase subunit A
MSELHYLSATEAVALMRAKELSPVELLDAVVARTEQVEPWVNATTEQLLDEAYAAARESADRYAGPDPRPRPLEGVPLALKEEQPWAGRTLEEASLLEKGNVAEVTHPVVERVLAAGAVVHARTTTPEFSCAPFTHSTLWGVTRNPWNQAMSPGGSSGGSGAALASGMTLLATGSDIGGSIRLPASLCGVVGFKPPFGRVPGLAPFNQDTYCADGPMGRTVADVALLQDVLAGPHPADQASLRPVVRVGGAATQAVGAAGARGLRVALCVRLGDYPVDPAVEAATRASAELLRAAGAQVDEVELPWTRDQVAAAAWAHFGAIFGASVSTMAGDQAELLMPYTRDFARRAAEHASGTSYLEGLVAEQALYAPLGALLERYDALLAPTVAAQGWTAGDDHLGETVEVAGVAYHWSDVIMTIPFNVVGRVPVLALPSGIAPNGVPMGVQVVGRTYDDPTVFRVGAALEAAHSRWASPSWRPGL